MKFSQKRKSVLKLPWLKGKGKYILLFLNGFILALLAYFYVEDNYEKQLFKALAAHVRSDIQPAAVDPNTSTDSTLIKSLHLVHFLEKNRAEVFGNYDVNGLKAQLIQPVTYDLMTGKQACGGFTYVLGRLLSEMNVDVRFAQMKVNGQFGGHILLEAKTPQGWVVLDPSFNVYFKKPDGQLASFSDVRSNWALYKQQLPANYVMDYRYEDVRYTNWDKIPVLMPFLKNIISWTAGKEKAETYSFRNLVLRKFNFLFNVTLVIYLILMFITIRSFVRQRKRANSFTPELLFPKKTNSSQMANTMA